MSLPPSVLDELSPDARIKLLSREVHKVSSQIGEIRRSIANGIKWVLGMLAAAALTIIATLVLIGQYRERVDQLTRSMDRMEQRVEQLGRQVSALTAAVEERDKR